MRVPEVIAAHTNTDFDAFAGMVAAAKLYPRARICLSGAVNQNVRRFSRLHADRLRLTDASDIDLDAVGRLVLLETADPNRLGELGPVLRRDDVEVIVFDHHRADATPLPERYQVLRSTDGAVTTLLLRLLVSRGIPVSAFEATVFALGIHEDTGSLTFTTTTENDAEAVAYCMRQGASAVLIERFLHHPLVADQRRLLAHALESAEAVDSAGGIVLLAALEEPSYVEEVAVVAHRFLDVSGADAFFLLVGMEDRVFVVARARLGALDVAEVLAEVGGGGHAAAASAVVRDKSLAEVREVVRAAVGRVSRHAGRAADLVSEEATVIDADESIDRALVLCHRRSLGGLLISSGGVLVGSSGEDDLRRASAHGLGHAPIKAVMSHVVPAVEAETPGARLAEEAAASPTGHVAVLKRGVQRGREQISADSLLGLVRGGDVLGRAVAELPAEPGAPNLASRLTELGLDDLLEDVQAVATGYAGVYLVGGAVRDLLLRERTFDIDLAVEGDGIAFAEELARRLNGHVRPHPKFRTAVVAAAEQDGTPGIRVDVASTRSELYDYPAALPSVEPAPLRRDLARRDFTINAMAVSLKTEDLGTLYDPFRGLQDLSARRIAVLHNLSFIEDPTRLFRALRYETRYGFRMEPRTLELARACADMDLVGDLSSARLRDELVVLLGERAVDHALRRLNELGLGRSIHPRLTVGASVREWVRAADALWLRHGLAGEVPLWRLRMTLLLRDLSAEDIVEWAERMRIKRADGRVLARALVIGRRLAQRVREGMSDADLVEVARSESLEAVLVAMVLERGTATARRLASYLDRTRHIRLEIDGDDLRALGLAPSPRIGEVLRSVLRLKIDGVVQGREGELAAARRLVG